MTIGNICIFKTNFPEADFWLQRKGSEKTVGAPTKEYYDENIGVKIMDEFKDKVDPGYLYYYFQYLPNKGCLHQLLTEHWHLKMFVYLTLKRFQYHLNKKGN